MPFGAPVATTPMTLLSGTNPPMVASMTVLLLEYFIWDGIIAP